MVSVTSVWPYAVVMSALVALAWIVRRFSPFFQHVLQADAAPPTPRDPSAAAALPRYLGLDGLRGFLATGVIFCHSVTNYYYFSGKAWSWPPSRFYTMIGQVPVILFFMITGFLFWSKAMKKPLNVRSFYRARFFRIMPLYGLLVGGVLLVVAVQSHFSLRVPTRQLFVEIFQLLVPGLRPSAVINGVDVKTLLMMSWTLWYECAFYLIFPLLALCTGWRKFSLLCLVAVVAYAAGMYAMSHHQASTLTKQLNPSDCILFLLGMITAQILPILPAVTPWRRRLGSLLALACLFVLLATHFSDDAFDLLPSLLVFVAFTCIAWGADFFGLLTTAPARLLGTIGYSVYLLHMFVLYLVLNWVNTHTPIADLGPKKYWALTGLCAMLIVLCSTVTYRFFEHPFLGQKAARKTPALQSPSSPSVAQVPPLPAVDAQAELS